MNRTSRFTFLAGWNSLAVLMFTAVSTFRKRRSTPSRVDISNLLGLCCVVGAFEERRLS